MPTWEEVQEAEAGDMELKEPAGPHYSIQPAAKEHHIGEDPFPAMALRTFQAGMDFIASFTQEWSLLGYKTPWRKMQLRASWQR